MPNLASIHVYPIKSLDGVSLDECRVLPSGALEHDRMLAITDSSGNIVNGKRYPAVHLLRARFDLNSHTVSLLANGRPATQFHLLDEHAQMSTWLSDFFGFAVQLQSDLERGFPDDLDSPGPTVLSTESLAAVSQWFPNLHLAETRCRFRANLELQGDGPFWEDRLFRADGEVRFRIGQTELIGTNPCQRCAVPTRSPVTGEPIPGFSRIFSEQRQRSLPSWAAVARFDHYYRLAVNTRLGALNDGLLRVGEEVQLVS